MKKDRIKKILTLMKKEYGNREWQHDDDPISVLVQTILSQNTSDRNSHRAFASLITSFKNWERVAEASITQVADTIRPGGLAEVKARYIKQALQEIKRRRGELNLEFLKQLSVDAARDWLMQLPGVGMKTASCVLLFSLGMPALPVDTHVSRVARRLGLLDGKISIDKAHRLLEGIVPPNHVYTFHVLLIEHGRKVCKAQRPQCPHCVIRKICPGYREFSRLSTTSSY